MSAKRCEHKTRGLIESDRSAKMFSTSTVVKAGKCRIAVSTVVYTAYEMDYSSAHDARIADTLAQMFVPRIVCKAAELVLHGLGERCVVDM